MATYIKIQGNQYPATITGKSRDIEWNNRPSKSIRLEMSYAEVAQLFADDTPWSILQEVEKAEEQVIEEVNENTGELEHITTIVPTTVLEEYDNSEYSVVGDIIVHRDGTITVKMGKLTAEELLAILKEVL